jgi:hydroxyethylthiazole kinase-like uncharacterized protein yjeF
MKIVTAENMRWIDGKTIEEYGIAGLVLMERAGLAVVAKIKELFSRRKIIVISGSGNNGGDGLVVARDLHNEGWDVRVFIASSREDLKDDALSQYKAADRLKVPIQSMDEFLADAHHSSFFSRHSLIVDALFGTGLSKPVKGRLSKAVDVINGSGLPVISVDIPSGISSDSGQIMGNAVRADYTVTFGLAKMGHILHPGAEMTGRLFVEDIGFPQELLCSERFNIELLEKKDVSPLIPDRKSYSHKGNYGHVLVVAGSRGKTGAALMAAKACLRTGAGLVTLGVPESLADIYQSRVTEEMTLILPDRGDGTLSEKASREILGFADKVSRILALGPGIGVSDDTEKLVRTIIRNSASPVVIDADGINSLKGDRRFLSKAKVPVILTPHPGEMARLMNSLTPPFTKRAQSGITSVIKDIEKDRVNTALYFAEETNTFLVLKGVPTVIATPDGKAFLNPTGNPGMATGGAGDVLTGIISGFLAQNVAPLHACVLGVYMHGLSGDIAASEKGEHSLIATDIINQIPAAFSSLKS